MDGFMARTAAKVSPGARMADFMSLGVLAERFPLDKSMKSFSRPEDRASVRQNRCPAEWVRSGWVPRRMGATPPDHRVGCHPTGQSLLRLSSVSKVSRPDDDVFVEVVVGHVPDGLVGQLEERSSDTLKILRCRAENGENGCHPTGQSPARMGATPPDKGVVLEPLPHWLSATPG